MAMEYINYLRSKAHLTMAEKSDKPVLSDEDEQFLNRITSQGDDAPPPLPQRPTARDAQLALMDGAQNVRLPDTPTEEAEEPEVTEGQMAEKVGEKADGKKGTRKRTTWSWMRRDSRDASKNKNQEATANSLMDVAEGIKASDAKPNEEGMVDDKEAEKEEEDMTIALDRLNLAAVNNRVFSLSAETQELLQKFNLIFKDLVNGVPTAYDDLEKLLTNSDRQLQGIYKSLPNFLQKLIEVLPNKMTTNFAPEIMAAAAERATMGGMSTANAGREAGKAAGRKVKIPTLKDLIGKPGAAATMLRSIVQFLRLRFPAFMGMNVLWSMAIFVLLIVFWYCHKRGREARLEKERELTEQEVARLDVEFRASHAGGVLMTTAEPGASIEDVKAGIEEAEAADDEITKMIDNGGQSEPAPSTLSATVQPAEKVGT